MLLELLPELEVHRRAGRRIVTTNGCFDGLHAGHVELFERARALGDVLVVGINSDASVRRLKGPGRPRLPLEDRARLVAALRSVDHVVAFEEDLPLRFLEAVRPQVHCKGGDYAADALPEARLVRELGGEIQILPLLEGRSSSLARLPEANGEGAPEALGREAHEVLLAHLAWSNVVRQTGYALAGAIVDQAALLHAALAAGRQLLVCGNGGSACDADHFAAELVGRFRRVRDGVPVVNLSAGAGVLTSLANDFGFAEAYRLQLVAFGRPGDVLIAISTSGKSENIQRILSEARARGIRSLLITGRTGGPAGQLADAMLNVPSDDTPEIQQAHRAVLHALCERLDALLAGGEA